MSQTSPGTKIFDCRPKIFDPIFTRAMIAVTAIILLELLRVAVHHEIVGGSNVQEHGHGCQKQQYP
jgi:hypothetical protein